MGYFIFLGIKIKDLLLNMVELRVVKKLFVIGIILLRYFFINFGCFCIVLDIE